jgi:hypothetical protein
MARAREASDTADLTASSVGHIGTHGRDNVVGGGRSLQPNATTGNAACSVSVTLTEVCVPRFRLGRPLTGSIRPHLAWAT